MSVGEVAGLIAACAFALLVLVLAVPLVKLGRVLDETRLAVRGLTDESLPLVREVTSTVATANSQLTKVDGITSAAEQAVGNVTALTSTVATTVAGPLVRVSALGYAARKALKDLADGPSVGRRRR